MAHIDARGNADMHQRILTRGLDGGIETVRSTLGEESIELVHEALIRHGSLLRESIDVFFCSCLPRSFPLGK